MNKIYVVEEGHYSDHTILGAFSTKEKAEEFIKKNRIFSGYDDPWISVWGLDGFVPDDEDLNYDLGPELFEVTIIRSLGTKGPEGLWEVFSRATGPVEIYYGTPTRNEEEIPLDKVFQEYGPTSGLARVYSRDAEKAVKIASDWAAARNAELEGIT